MCDEVSRLRFWREQANLSQRQLAKRVGWTSQKVSHLERHPERCHILEAVTLASALNLPAVALYPILGTSPPLLPSEDTRCHTQEDHPQSHP